MVDKDISVANFKAIMFAFLKEFFKENIDIRFRPGYFPFTEPSFEIDVRTKKGEWLELMGAGMVHPEAYSLGHWHDRVVAFRRDRQHPAPRVRHRWMASSPGGGVAEDRRPGSFDDAA